MTQAERETGEQVLASETPLSVILSKESVDDMLEFPLNRPVEFAQLSERHPDIEGVSYVMASFRATMSEKAVDPRQYQTGFYAFLLARASQFPLEGQEQLGEAASEYIYHLSKVDSDKKSAGQLQRFNEQVNADYKKDPEHILGYGHKNFPDVTDSVRWRSKIALKEFGVRQRTLMRGLRSHGIRSVFPPEMQMIRTSFIWGIVDADMMLKYAEDLVDDKTLKEVSNLVDFMTMPYRNPLDDEVRIKV